MLDKSIRKNKLEDVEIQLGQSRGITTTNSDNAEAKEEQLGEERIDGKVGLMRTRATFWKGSEWGCDIGEHDPRTIRYSSIIVTRS